MKTSSNEKKLHKAKESIKYFIISFIALIFFEIIAYFAFLNTIPEFLSRYGIWLLYLNISVISIGLMIWYALSYKSNVNCMTGMMIGMTFGMQTGMMIGAVVGATNGFFTGAMTGMILGVIVGALMGRCCGVMGVMEGLMAGVMGGTMGPMISVMMFNDHLQFFMPFYFIINLIIVFGLGFMYYKEVVEPHEFPEKNIGLLTFTGAILLMASIIILIMIYGPKSGLFQ